MQYVIETATGEMVYAFADDAPVDISDGGLSAPGLIACDIRPETHEIIRTPIPCPSAWGREYRWTGAEWIGGSARRWRITERLSAIDAASIRPARAVTVGTATADDIDRLHALETEAAALRAELAAMGG